MDSTTAWGVGISTIIIIAIIISLLPIIIAFKRQHHYKWIIVVLCLFPIGITWLIAFIWSLWPQEKSLIDPLAGNVTGLGKRNAGDTAGSVKAGSERGYIEEVSTINGISNSTSIPNSVTPQLSRNLFDGEMSLENGSYQIFLLKKHKIEKIDALSKFSCQEKLFDTSDEALKYADFLEQKEIALVQAEIDQEKQRQEERRQEEQKAKEAQKVKDLEKAERRKALEIKNEANQAEFKKLILIAISVVAVVILAIFGYKTYADNKVKSEQASKYNQIKEVTTKFGLVGTDGAGIKWSKDCSSSSYNFFMNKDSDKTGNWVTMIDPPQQAITFTSQDISLENGALKMIGTVTTNTSEGLKSFTVGSPFVLTLKKVNGGIRIIDWTIGPNIIAKNGKLDGGNGDPTNLQLNCSKSN